jgi:hypothetical protein
VQRYLNIAMTPKKIPCGSDAGWIRPRPLEMIDSILENLAGDEIIWEGLASLLNRQYWTRIWIVQEFTLGPNLEIHCG